LLTKKKEKIDESLRASKNAERGEERERAGELLQSVLFSMDSYDSESRRIFSACFDES